MLVFTIQELDPIPVPNPKFSPLVNRCIQTKTSMLLFICIVRVLCRHLQCLDQSTKVFQYYKRQVLFLLNVLKSSCIMVESFRVLWGFSWRTRSSRGKWPWHYFTSWKNGRQYRTSSTKILHLIQLFKYAPSISLKPNSFPTEEVVMILPVRSSSFGSINKISVSCWTLYNENFWGTIFLIRKTSFSE